MIQRSDNSTSTTSTSTPHPQSSIQPRRAHRKSRFGCTSCKQRRVKCDEAGPPCGPCRLRSTKCEYAAARIPAPTPQEQSNSPASSPHRSTPTDHLLTPPSDTALSNVSPADVRSVRLLELELMHQWTMHSYKCICGGLEEQFDCWQNQVPRTALKYDFLMYGIFAVAALEIAAEASPSIPDLPSRRIDGDISPGRNRVIETEFLQHALSYHNKALMEFRSALIHASSASPEACESAGTPEIDPESHQALCLISSLLIALGLGFSRFPQSGSGEFSTNGSLGSTQGTTPRAISTLLLLFELVSGGGAVLLTKSSALEENALFRDMVPWEGLRAREINPDVQNALGRLARINDAHHGSSASPRTEAEHLYAIAQHSTCRRAVYFLRECFSRCSEPATRGYILGWMNLVGRDFVQAVETEEPVALLILMHFGVLLQQQSYGLWWVGGIGRKLVGEVSDALDTQGGLTREMGDAVSWALREVNLR